jgi:hypothetical protein
VAPQPVTINHVVGSTVCSITSVNTRPPSVEPTSAARAACRAAEGDGDRRVRRGLSMRDVESLYEQAGLGKLSKLTAARICSELRERFAAFQRRDLYEIHVAALFLDATFLGRASERAQGRRPRRLGLHGGR